MAAEIALVRSKRPTHLHVVNNWPPDVRHWVEDLAAADSDADSLLLESVGTEDCRGIRWRLQHLSSRTVVGNWTLRHPIGEVRLHHEESAALLAAICRDHAVDHLLVSSLLGHSLDLFRTGLPVTRIYHDYFPHCPAFFLTRDALCTSCHHEDLRESARQERPPRPKGSPGYYQKIRDAYFEVVAEADVRHVSPSAALPRHLRTLDRRWESIEFHVIPNGSNESRRDLFGGAEEGRRLRIGIPRWRHWYEGSEVLGRILPVLRTLADLYLLGAREADARCQRRWGVHLVDDAPRSEASRVFGRLRLDLVLFLPVVHVVSSPDWANSVRFCLPSAARPVGTFEEQIDHGSNGFLLGPDDDDIITFVLWADRERSELRRISAALKAMDETEIRTVHQELAEYDSLRGELSEAVP